MLGVSQSVGRHGPSYKADLFEGGQQLTGRCDFHHDCARHHHHALGILLDLQPGLPHLITKPRRSLSATVATTVLID